MQVEPVLGRSRRKGEATALRCFYLGNQRQRQHGHGHKHYAPFAMKMVNLENGRYIEYTNLDLEIEAYANTAYSATDASSNIFLHEEHGVRESCNALLVG